jgi:FtsZ-binding cell division protein ZapB
MDRETVETVARALMEVECSKCRERNAWLESQAVRELKKELRKLQRENRRLRSLNTRLIRRLNKIGVVW